MVAEVKTRIDDRVGEVEFDLEESVRKIRGLSKRTVEDVVEVGRELKRVKDHLEHGLWEKWVREELRWHPATASRYIKAVTRYENLASTQELDELAFIQKLWGNSPKKKQTKSQEDVLEYLEIEVDRFNKTLSHLSSQIGSCGNLTSTTIEKLRNLAQALTDILENSESKERR